MKIGLFRVTTMVAALLSLVGSGSAQMPTTIFVDLGDGFGAGTKLANVQAGDVTKVNVAVNSGEGDALGGTGYWTGPVLSLADDDDFEIKMFADPDVGLAHDFNQDNQVDNADLDHIWLQIQPRLEHIVEPFNIRIERAAASQIKGTTNVPGSITYNMNRYMTADAYVWVIGTIFYVEGGAHVPYGGTSARGQAAQDDQMQQINNTDELALIFGQNTLDAVNGDFDQFYNAIARVIVHEAFHTFTFAHTVSGSDDEGLMSDGDVIRPQLPSPFVPIVTRFSLEHAPGNNAFGGPFPTPSGWERNHYVLAKLVFGLKKIDGNPWKPDLAYITGTGAHDRIELTWDAATGEINVDVDAYSDPGRTNSIDDAEGDNPHSYHIELSKESDADVAQGPIVRVDCGRGNDELIIDKNIPAGFIIDGGNDTDKLSFKNTAGSDYWLISTTDFEQF